MWSFQPLQPYVARWPPAIQTVWAGLSAFAVYFGMYAFRKTFKVGTWTGQTWFSTGISLKTAYVLAQLFGYLFSKFIGIKVVSEAVSKNRFIALVLLVGFSEIALVIVGLLDPNWAVIGYFLNGLPLGLVWGLVVSYIEGRRSSDVLLAMLCCSFVVSTGYVKDCGLLVMEVWGVSEHWMPAVVGALVFPAFVVACFCLHQTPPPTAKDKAIRGERTAMDHAERLGFFKALAPGLIACWALMTLLTAYRDYRDTFQREIFLGMGYSEVGAFSFSETVVGAALMVMIALVVLVQNNFWGLAVSIAMVFAGALVLVAGQVGFHFNIDGMAFMVLTGLGSYMGYVPFNSILFERVIAYTGLEATVSFPMQVSDALGYVGVTVIYLMKEFAPKFSYLEFFMIFGWVMAAADAVLSLAMAYYFLYHIKSRVQSGLPLDVSTRASASAKTGAPLETMSDDELLHSDDEAQRASSATRDTKG